MHRIVIVLGLSFALVSCGGDEDGEDDSSRYDAPASSVTMVAEAIVTPVLRDDEAGA